ncbi:hypothetical protein [Falsirhodobacter sp. 20TX0035]|uniref:hypothetical protein n=1 Tax=Falsirhodobacter sp. 20TX0035 TaxID=3022019 RepID=UPI00232DA4BB|nr:hypothetical protein [Falsirhodobacter sp. 20TX0035]MDB6455029.1 hypothetical protein [Falsirhodobacter sp. 20TX0035]
MAQGQEPDLIVSAGFSDAQLVKEADKVVAFYRRRGEEAQKAFQDAQGRVINTQAARAHAKELDRLSRSYDPAYRAAKQYEDEVKRLDRAMDVGAISQEQYAAKVTQAAGALQAATTTTRSANNELLASFRRTETSAQALERGTDQAGGGMAALRGQVQNTAFQFQDFVVQVQGGTAATTAAAQQLPQLLGAFGALGAVLGLVAALAIPVGAALFRAGRDSEEAANKSKTFDDALSEVRAAMADFADVADTRGAEATEAMIERFGRADAAVRGLMERLREASQEEAFEGFELSIDKAMGGLGNAQDRVAEIFGRFNQMRAEQEAAQSRLTELEARPKINDRTVFGAQEATERLNLMDLQEEARRLNEEVAQFGIKPAQIESVNEYWRALDAALDAKNFTEAADQLEHIQAIFRSTGSKELADVADGLDEITVELREGAEVAGEVALRVEDISLAAGGISFDGAVDGALNLADALSTAARKLADLESSQARQLARARIRQEFFNNPVGEAEALARDEFRSTLPEDVTLTPEQQADFAEREATYAANAAEEERINQQRIAAERAAAEASRSGRKGTSDAAKEAKKKDEKLADILDGDDITALERQIELIGKNSVETARMRAEWAMTDEARRAGIPLTDELTAKIAQQAEEVGRLTGELERGQLEQAQFDQAVDGIAGSISNVLVQGQSLRQGLAGIFKGIAADILNSGIRNALKGTLAGMGGGSGGGIWGSVLGAVTKGFGGFRADGGPVQAGKAYVVGERGPEVIVPGAVGTVIPNHRLGGGKGGATFAPVFHIGGQVTQSDIDRLNGAMGKLRADVPAIMSNHQARYE